MLSASALKYAHHAEHSLIFLFIKPPLRVAFFRFANLGMYGDEKPPIGQLYDDGVVDQQAFKSVEEINEHKKRIASKLNAVADDYSRYFRIMN